MTVQEMMYEFQRLIETISKDFEVVDKPNSETIVRFLNWGYDRYIKEKYLSFPIMKENIEFVRRNANDLRQLIVHDVTEIPVAQDPLDPRILKFTIPTTFYFYIRGDAKITRTAAPVINVAEYVPMEYIEYGDIDNILTNTYNKPLILKPFVNFNNDSGKGGIVFVDDYTFLSTVRLTYLRKPKELDLNTDDTTHTTECELSSYMHEEIVKFAVDMYINSYKFRLGNLNNENK